VQHAAPTCFLALVEAARSFHEALRRDPNLAMAQDARRVNRPELAQVFVERMRKIDLGFTNTVAAARQQ